MHSKELEETAIWKYYRKKSRDLSERCAWVKEVYKCCTEYLSYVNKTFANYTLHDKTHILNVLDAIGGLLGDRIKELTPGEAEVLILSASIHDLGMVYTDEEINECYSDERKYNRFAHECCPELLGTSPEEWSDENRQWYLRTMHSFRIKKVLGHEEWKEILQRQPVSMVSMEYVLSVCQAHGETPNELHNNRNLTYLSADDTDTLFCALLLRMGDLLDFDDTRAPRVLFNYANNEKSIEEIKKHRFSAGFSYPETPSLKELPYKAKCTDPGIEHAVRDFLNWIDEELMNCSKLQKRCHSRWQDFPLPRAISREGIESCGYMSGDFCITMDQNQILKLLTGENLYDSPDVFVRELLQNSIDATLLRSKMDSYFKPENSRIDFWEWIDREGNTWFRIDDRGTGMTLGMLQRYFLKVGNSYYNSKELKRDLQDHGSGNEFYGISQFGIGFLSCFLCADYAEVSTLYFDEEKNRREEEITDSYAVDGFGLRMQITGLSGYYMLKNQAKGNRVNDPLPYPDGVDMELQFGIEKAGYRSKAGTSIVLRLDPGKLGGIDLQKTLEEYLCYPRVPVYYNNKKVGYTHDELMNAANEMAGEHVYELPKKYKEEFDRCFPEIAGHYPKVVAIVVSIDMEKNHVLTGFSGVIIKKYLEFNRELEWDDLELKYEKCSSSSESIKNSDMIRNEMIKDINKNNLWKSYHNYYHRVEIKISLDKILKNFDKKLKIDKNETANLYSYNGIKSYRFVTYGYDIQSIFFLEGQLKPTTTINRSNIIDMPLEAVVTLNKVLVNYGLNHIYNYESFYPKKRKASIKEWRKIKNSFLGDWLNINSKKQFDLIKEIYTKNLSKDQVVLPGSIIEYGDIIYFYIKTCLQEDYKMTINYENGQIISFEKKEENTPDIFDMFPPLVFCKAANERSRQYICAAEHIERKGITIDHPYVTWLLNNAIKLKKYYSRQFEQIVDCLFSSHADDIIQNCNQIREQLIKSEVCRGIDVSNIPKLSKKDFWYGE